MSFSGLLEHYQMDHVEWGVFWNSITVQAISRGCSGIGWTPFHWGPLVMVFMWRIWIHHTLCQLMAQSWSIYKCDMLFQLLHPWNGVSFFWKMFKHAVEWVSFSVVKIRLFYGNDYLHCNFMFWGIWRISPTCVVKDLVSKRSQWIMFSPRQLEHVFVNLIW